MKIRMRENSLRLRLSRSEASRIGEGGEVIESVRFSPDSVFRYTLLARFEARSVDASFEKSTITVTLPSAVAREWAFSDSVSLHFDLPHGLHLLIEKDFACLKPRDQHEDESDLFANPNAAHGSCS